MQSRAFISRIRRGVQIVSQTSRSRARVERKWSRRRARPVPVDLRHEFPHSIFENFKVLRE